MDGMANERDAGRLRDDRIEVEGCDHPQLFWHQVKARDGRTAFREGSRHLARHELAGLRRRRAPWAWGWSKLGLQRNDVVSTWPRPSPSGSTSTWEPYAGGVSNGIYPTDSAKRVEYIANDSRSRFLFVGERGAARQVHRHSRTLPSIVKVFVFDMEGLADFKDPMVMPFDDLLALGRAHDLRRAPACGRSWSPDRRPTSSRCWSTHSAPRGRPGRDAVAPQRNLPDLNADAFIPIGHRRRAARLPAALPCRRAHLHRLPALCGGRHRQFRRERRDGAGEHP